MPQTYQGHFRDGQFIPVDAVSLPDDVEVLMVITDRTVSMAKRQGEAIKRFMAAIDTINDATLTEEDFAELENNRADFSREIKL